MNIDDDQPPELIDDEQPPELVDADSSLDDEDKIIKVPITIVTGKLSLTDHSILYKYMLTISGKATLELGRLPCLTTS